MKSQFVVAVTGGRKYQNKARVWAELDALYREHANMVLVVGDATGADCFARAWATARGVPLRVYKANWALYDKAAGPIRNQEMLDDAQPNLLVAFPGQSGTADCTCRAQTMGIHVLVVVDLVIQTAQSAPAIERSAP